MSAFTRFSFPVLATLLTFLLCVVLLIFATITLYEESQSRKFLSDQTITEEVDLPFPVGVNYFKKTIAENPEVDRYVKEYLALDVDTLRRDRFLEKLFARINASGIYQQFASPLMRTLVIYPGERREEVVRNFADILNWTKAEEASFADLVTESAPLLADGKFFPGHYQVTKDALPETVAAAVLDRFSTQILARYDETVKSQVPLGTALIVASLLEREAYDFTDMRIISGVIWNRLFINMPLQLDATLQYARGSLASEAKWWPIVRPADKYIDSPFNTYEVKGLPPSPIANPSLEALIAALNPRTTDCLFYFHHTDGTFYCSATYEDHVAQLRALYGQGR